MDANDHNADEVVAALGKLSYKLKRELVTVIREEADALRDAIKDAARRGKTGNLAASVIVKRGRNSLELVISAGGALTTKEVRAGSGHPYDYALGEEWGNSHSEGKPFFYSTYRARKDAIDARIQDKWEEIVERAWG